MPVTFRDINSDIFELIHNKDPVGLQIDTLNVHIDQIESYSTSTRASAKENEFYEDMSLS